jgi:type II secretory pathway component PulC
MNIAKIIDRYIWVVNLLLLFLAAYFLAAFINFQMSKKYLLEQAVTVKQPPTILANSGYDYHPSHSAIVDGNIFGTVPRPPAEKEGEGGPTTVANIEAELTGVIYFSEGNKLNQATIRLKQENKTDVYKIGDEVSPGVTVADIQPTKVVLNLGSARTQELFFVFGQPPNAAMQEGEYVDPYSRMPPDVRARALLGYRQKLVDDNIQQIGDNFYKIQKSAIEKTLGNLNEVMTQARMIPNMVQDGSGQKMDGFKIFNIKSGSIYQKLGMRDGDVIRKINNAPMDNVEKGLELLQALRYEKKFDIDILRGSQPVQMNYQVVE